MKRIHAVCSVVFLYLFVSIANAQGYYTGTPLIVTYKPSDFEAYPKNASIIQNKDGIMFFGNRGKILSFDGNTWRHITFKDGVQVNSMALDSLGVLYVSGSNEYGFCLPDRNGNLVYHSLSGDSTSQTDNTAETSNNVMVTDDRIYFQNAGKISAFSVTSAKNIRKYPDSKDIKPFVQSKTIHAETIFTGVFPVDDNRTYIIQKDKGLMQLSNGVLTHVKGGKLFAWDDYEIVNILPYGDDTKQILIVTRSKGIFSFIEGGGPSEFKTANDLLFHQDEILEAIPLDNERFVICSQRQGILILDIEGNILEKYAKSAELPVELITAAYFNPESPNLLWIATNYGISKIMLRSPIRTLNESRQIQGIVFDVTKHKNRLFARSMSDLYYLHQTAGSTHDFLKIEGISAPRCWLEYPVTYFDEETKEEKTEIRLLVGAMDGIYEVVNQNEAKKIENEGNFEFDFQNIRVLHRSQLKPRRIYVGHKDGVSVISRQQGLWINEGQIDSITGPVSSVLEDEKGMVWAGFEEGELANFEFLNDSAKAAKILVGQEESTVYLLPDTIGYTSYRKTDVLPPLQYNGIVKLKSNIPDYSDIVFLTQKGLYRYNKNKKNFVQDHEFDKHSTAPGIIPTKLIKDKEGNCWILHSFIYGTNLKFFKKIHDGVFTLDQKAVTYVPPLTVENIYLDDNQILWICSNEGLYNLDTKAGEAKRPGFKALITKVSLGIDSVIYAGQNYISGYQHDIQQIKQFDIETTLPELDYKNKSLKLSDSKFPFEYQRRSIMFQFASTFFEYEDELEYRYMLKGFDAGWSNWTHKTEKEYTFLPEGKYTFKVEARNIYGEPSETGAYSFEVLPPWYKADWAIITGAVLLVLIIVFFFRIYFRRLRRKNEQLEKQVKARTSEIVKQKEEIEGKNAQLEEQQKDIMGKNEELKQQQEEITAQRDELSRTNEKLESINTEIEVKNKELTSQKKELERTLKKLTETQQQLVQQEKLASLGQLTAGVAHEIKNPLNFANNFSKLSLELLDDDLKEVLDSKKSAIPKELLDEMEDIFKMLRENLNSIVEETDRADRIIKDMLQHSRGTAGKFEKTDMNKLINEYTTLAYKSIRGKEKSFKLDIDTQFDENLKEVVVSPQDLSRVIINIVNNSCFAMLEKQKQEGKKYKPALTISTKKKQKEFEISLRDNGTGIPQDIIDKIFNPFFSTKDPGKGTGLGLSISHDIISQLHNGTMEVKSEAGEYTEFTIKIPNSLEIS